MFPFHQVNVFAKNPLKGNPLAVVTCREEVPSDEDMINFAKWTNLSETTFLLPPKCPDADYLVRIWTPTLEMKFAGHPTLGTAFVYLLSHPEKTQIVQECPIGLVTVKKIENGKLAFKAPPLETEEMDSTILDQILEANGLTRDDIAEAIILNNGPTFYSLRLKDYKKLTSITPDWSKFPNIHVNGLCAIRDDGELEVRSLIVDMKTEDPITGSLNAALAKWLLGNGTLKGTYLSNQGRCIDREGILEITEDGDDVWIAGDIQTVIEGTVNF